MNSWNMIRENTYVSISYRFTTLNSIQILYFCLYAIAGCTSNERRIERGAKVQYGGHERVNKLSGPFDVKSLINSEVAGQTGPIVITSK
jgi:hypothetical protein